VSTRSLAVAVVMLLAVGLAACQKRDQSAADSDQMSEQEIAQGRDFCARYVARVCACASASAELASACEDARSQPKAYEMVLKVIGGSEGAISRKERRLLETDARKVVAACVAADGALDPKTCPR
jgi:hypothetical protein